MKPHVKETDIPNEPQIREGEHWISGRNNQLIFFCRDRPGDENSGHGDEAQAGSLNLVVGRKNQDVDFASDSAFAYISMKTDVDKNLSIDGMTDGEGNKLEPKSNSPAVILKSDSVRIVHRQSGDIRITSDDGQNFIMLSPDRCEIKLGTSWLKIADGKITIEAGEIDLGAKVTDKVVLGDKFMTLFNAHTHQSPVGPTSNPLQPMSDAQLSAKSKVE